MLNTPLTQTLDTFLPDFYRHDNAEYMNGDWSLRMPGGYLHSLIIKRLFVLLLALEERGLGEVYQETAFVAVLSSQWVKGSRIPDVQYIIRERLDQYRQTTPDWKQQPLVLVPDLAIEVISPNDHYVDVVKKCEIYLQDGVQRVWLVEPDTQTIVVYTNGSPQQQVYRVGDTLMDDVLMPDLVLNVGALFGD